MVLSRVVAAAMIMALAGCATPAGAPSPDAKAALTPTGDLRVAFVATSIYAVKDPQTGELKGVAIDLGQDLARRVGAPYKPVVVPNVAALLAGAKANEFDVALMGINAERAMAVDFAAPYMEVELGYLVGAGSRITSMADIDRAGVRVGVLQNGGSDLELTKTLKDAQIVRVGNVGELYGLIAAGKAEVIAATKTALLIEADKMPGSRVLPGRFLVEPIGAGVPKGRNPSAVAYLAQYIETAKADGTVAAAIKQAGLRGVTVAPAK